MTRTEFDSHYAATSDNWFEPETLDRLNDLAFEYLRDEQVDEDGEVDSNVIKFAFDRANNAL